MVKVWIRVCVLFAVFSPFFSRLNAGLETYFFSYSQTFASGFNLNLQIAVSNSQLVFPTFEHFLTLRCDMPSYGYSFLGLELGSKFSPPLAEDLLTPAFFFPSFKEIHYFFRIFFAIAVTWQDSESVLRGA